jgi:hypothetical protein
VMSGVFGMGKTGEHNMSATEKANIAPFILLNQVLRPIASTLVPKGLAGSSPLELVDTVTSGGHDANALYQRIAALEAAVEELKNG